jgi:hypothetical protein
MSMARTVVSMQRSASADAPCRQAAGSCFIAEFIQDRQALAFGYNNAVARCASIPKPMPPAPAWMREDTTPRCQPAPFQ